MRGNFLIRTARLTAVTMGSPSNAQTYGIYTWLLVLFPDRRDIARGPLNVLTLRDNIQECNDFPVEPDAHQTTVLQYKMRGFWRMSPVSSAISPPSKLHSATTNDGHSYQSPSGPSGDLRGIRCVVFSTISTWEMGTYKAAFVGGESIAKAKD